MIDSKEAYKLTCFNSLAYCCGLQKDCSARNKAMKMLGLSKKDYKKLKKKFDRDLEILKG